MPRRAKLLMVRVSQLSHFGVNICTYVHVHMYVRVSQAKESIWINEDCNILFSI